MIELSDFIRYAMSAYIKPHCITIAEFKQDVNKFKRLNRLMSSEEITDIQVNSILNHILTLYNVFEHEKCTKMMFSKIDKEKWFLLKTFLVYLNSMPERIDELKLYSSDLPISSKIADILRKIK